VGSEANGQRCHYGVEGQRAVRPLAQYRLRYETVWTLHIQKSIGRRRIAALTPFDVEQYLRTLKDSGLSQERVRRIRAILHRACRLARKWSGNTLPNPITDTELPVWSLTEGSDDVRSPSVDEVKAILGVARTGDPRIAAFIRLVTATGLRRGEACALRWSDVDMDSQRIRVDTSVVIGRSGIQVKAPNTLGRASGPSRSTVARSTNCEPSADARMRSRKRAE